MCTPVSVCVFRFAGSHLQMELLRDGSPGSSAEVRVSNKPSTPRPAGTKKCTSRSALKILYFSKCYDTLFKQTWSCS